MSSNDKETPHGLLSAVLANPELRERLANMPADEKTVTLSSSNGLDLEHPAWHRHGSESAAISETVDLPVDASIRAARPTDKGFVPRRRVATLSNVNNDDDYRIVGRLGSGGTGVVYQAHQRAIDREVAIKVLRDELSISEVSRERFLTEARVIGGLDHPNVIALHEVCVDDDGGLFYSMKRIDGTSWDQRIGELSVSENVSILLRVSDAIRYAHSRGLIHRDIKPENVMLGRFGEVLLADWGLAISHGSNESKAGINQSIGGTPAYMAPELADSLETGTTYQTDVYLLGAILFQILTGHPPHDGKTLLACIQAAARNEIRETDVEGELMDIARKALSSHPEDRYESVDDFIAALNHQRQHDESARLVRRALERLATASDEHQYEDFRVADALLMEALDIWPANSRASEARQRLQLRFAEAATRRGDLDLAMSIYESAGAADSEQAVHVRQLRRQRETSHQQVSRYSVLFTEAPEAGLLIQMSSGLVVEANLEFERLFGYQADEVVNRSIEDLNLWVCPERRNKLVQELSDTGLIDNFEATFLHTDGHSIEVLISGRVVTVQGEEMVVSTIRDISIRKQAENDLKKSRQRLRDLQHLAGLATWSYDVASEEVTWSEEAFQLAGRTVEQGVPSKEEFYEMIHPEDRDILRQTINTALASGAAYELVIRQKGPRGIYKEVLLRGQPIFDDEGYTTELYGVMIPQKS